MLLIVSTNPAVDRTLEVPQIHLGQAQRALTVHLGAGGKGLNVARAARTLQVPYLVVGHLAGHSGALVADLARSEGLQADWLRLASGETRHCMLVQQHSGDTTVINEPGPKITGADWSTLEALIVEHAETCRAVAFAGSLPPSVSGQAYASLCQRLAEDGRLVLVDTSTDHLKEVVKDPRGLIIKVNAGELSAALGRPPGNQAELRQACRELVERGAAAVVVTLGERGALGADAGGVWVVDPLPVTLVSSVGSGDSFLAGLAAGLLVGEPLPQALTLGAACGAANAATRLPASFTLEAVRQLRERCYCRSS